MRRLPVVLFLPLVLACSGTFLKDCTATIVGKTVETTKGVTKGVAEGVEEGRKAGISLDGAYVAYGLADLEGRGGISVYALEAMGDTTRLVLAIDNTGDIPLRIVDISATLLDKEGFVLRPSSRASQSVTVPARAKDRVEFEFAIASDKVGNVRVWEQDLPLPH